MIEVEKKFLLSDEEEARLLAGASLLSEKQLADTYFDDAAWSVTKRGWWLRSRNGAFELKIPVSRNYGSMNQYHELTDDAEIASRLGLPADLALADALAQAGIVPLVTCVSTRRTYEKAGFHLDLDVATYQGDDLRLVISEIELMVNDESEVAAASERIIAFAGQHKIAPRDNVRGKLIEYLYHRRPEHYDALVESGVLPPEMARMQSGN